MTEKYESGSSLFYKPACASTVNSDQPAHPQSLIRVFAEHSVGCQES